MKKMFIAVLVVIAILVIGFFFFSNSGNFKKYEYLKEPQILEMVKQKMLVVEIKGDPNVVGKKAFSNLFSTYYKLKGIKKEFKIAPRARWPKGLSVPKNEWIGIYGLPIPENIEPLSTDAGISVKIEIWEYGKVAEILHVGSYKDEIPTIEKLRKFIDEKGYKIIGDHEEEYLKGPGMFFKGNPKNYLTIIRYRIKSLKNF